MNLLMQQFMAAWFILFNDDDDSDEEPCLSLQDRRRRSKKIPRIALKNYNQSAFRFLFDSGNDQALINCCAVDHKVFAELLEIFSPIFESYAIDSKTGLIKKLKPTAMGTRKGRPR